MTNILSIRSENILRLDSGDDDNYVYIYGNLH